MNEDPKIKILIAGVGNPLRQDDAFGVEFINRLIIQNSFPPEVVMQEVGIGGIHLVQELHKGFDTLILADAVNWNLNPGDVSIRIVDKVKNVEELPREEKRDFLADMHYTNPVRAMILAQSLNVLPQNVYLLGCQAKWTDDFAIGMSDEVQAAIPRAINLVTDWVKRYLANRNSESKFVTFKNL